MVKKKTGLKDFPVHISHITRPRLWLQALPVGTTQELVANYTLIPAVHEISILF
jgi:hypothetical protein